jgi:hypothetical protein
MKDQNVLVRRQPTRPIVRPRRPRPSYLVTLTETGKWLHAPGSDFVFAYLMNDWDATTKAAVTTAFEDALAMSSTIKAAVKSTSGQDVLKGLYLLDPEVMTEAMNSIDGMGETSAHDSSESGSGTAASINGQFFAAVLAGLGGDVAPLLDYLTSEMGDLQAQTKQSTVTESFGTVMGLISVMPVLNVPVTTFQYVYSSSQVSEWFVKVNCGSVEEQSYAYAYTVVQYNYAPPKKK